jgi:hypothetical protein
MTAHAEAVQALQAWREIPWRIERSIEGLSESQLDLRAQDPGLSSREIVHHLVEANLIAATILVAALARNGCTYDWSWVQPGGDWMKRMGYDHAPIQPALAALRSLSEYVSGLIAAAPDGFSRSVQLLDAPGAELYSKTVGGILAQEVEHAAEHLGTLDQIRVAHGL